MLTRNAFLVAICLAASASRLQAQTVVIPPLTIPPIDTAREQTAIEVTPLGGYRFGGDFFELVTGQPVDLDGAPVFGALVDFPLANTNGIQVEALFTHQKARVLVPSVAPRPAREWHVSVDHWQAGALQELSKGRARPFMNIMLGLTRYAAEGDNEIRFAMSGGGGVKLFPSPRLGVRLESRVFATFVDAGGAVACSLPGLCLLAIRAEIVWQLEFAAGLVLRFP